MKTNSFLLLAASFSLAMFLVFSCSGEGGSVIANIEATNNTDSEVWDGSVNTDWYYASQTEYTITTAQQLAGLAKLVNEGAEYFLDKTIKLGNNISLGNFDWTPIGKDATFEGTFDGNGYEIRGVNVKKNDEHILSGLFGGLDMNGEIKNLGVISSTINGTKDVGGLVGTNNGKISNSYFIGTVTGDQSVGGLVGQNAFGTISNSYSGGYVSGTGYTVGSLIGLNGGELSSCYSTSRVTGVDIISNFAGKYGEIFGGLVGFNYGDGLGIIMNSYSTGTVTGSSDIGGFVGVNNGEIINSYSIGRVSADSLTGGFAAWNEEGSIISNSFYNTETSGQSESFGDEGKTTAEMKEQTTFVGWDFSTIWGIDPAKNNGYPYLKEITP
ncbi:MAG: hypothetical protein FWC26_07950 [Fibromonadales bacterium]|nr:hypothetical protein [Fibromonadales bacterium]